MTPSSASSRSRAARRCARRRRTLAPGAASHALAQDDRRRGAPLPSTIVELGQVDRAQAEVAAGSRTQSAAAARVAASSRRAHAASVVTRTAGQPGHLGRERGHRRPGLEVALGVGPVDVPQVEGDEPPGGVEDVGGRGAGRRRRSGRRW